MNAANTVIEDLLKRQKVAAAMVLDALFVTDAIKLESIEIYGILHYFKLSHIPMPESILRKGLFQLAELKIFGTFKRMTRSKGRPLWHYTPKPIQKIAEILGVKLHRDENADLVPFAAFKSGKAYRAGKHYAHIARLGESTPSRKKLGARLGVKGRSTYNYEIGTRIKVESRWDEKELFKSDIVAAPKTRPNANIFLSVEFERPMTEDEFNEKHLNNELTWHELLNRTTKDRRKMPYTEAILWRELERGNRVFLRRQLSNKYTIS